MLIVDHVDFSYVRITVVASISSETQETFFSKPCSAHLMKFSVDAETGAAGYHSN